MKKGNLTFGFSVLQALFWMNACIHFSYATSYLQYLGYTNTKLGIILAVGNVLATLIGPFLTSLISSGKTRTFAMYGLCLFIQAVSDVLVLVIGCECIAVSLSFTLLIAFCFPINSIDLELYSKAINRSIHIDYGIGRGVGSLAYVIIMLAVGILLSGTPLRIISVFGLAITAAQFVAHNAFCSKLNSIEPDGNGAPAAEVEDKPLSFVAFIRTYRTYSIMLIGVILLSIGFRICNSFLINIVRNVGGDVSKYSFVAAMAAFVEVPVIVCYSQISKKISNSILFATSLVFLIIKHTILALTTSMAGVFIVQFLQAPSYALECASIVPFTNEAVADKDKAYAQSLAFSNTSVGYFFAGILGGILFDNCSVAQTVWVSVLFCLVGAFIAIPCIVKISKGRKAVQP